VQGRGVASKSRTKNTIIPAIYAVVKGIGLRKGQSREPALITVEKVTYSE